MVAQPTPMTLEEWEALDDDVEGELVNGILMEEEVPSCLHEVVVTWLSHVFGAWLGEKGWIIGSEANVDKYEEYAAFGVRWYWLVDPTLRIFEIYELGQASRYTRVVAATDAPIDAVPGCSGLSLDVPALWTRLDRLEGEGEEEG